MHQIEQAFTRRFAHWAIALPKTAVTARLRGEIKKAGWSIQYLFGEDERGEYLDYYASHLVATNLPAIASRTPQPSATTRLAIRNAGAVEYVPVSQLLTQPRVHEERSFTQGLSMQNEFRIAFDQLPPIDSEHGTRRAAVLPRIDLLTRALFLEGVSLDLTSVASMLMSPRGSHPINGNFYRAYSAIVDSGRILVAATGLAGARKTPYAFDLRHEMPFERRPTFGTLLRAYQMSDASDDAKRAASVATRLLVGLERYSSSDTVLAKAELIPCEAFHGLPDRFAAEIPPDARLARKTIQNSVSALRAVLQFGVRHDLFPLLFPQHRQVDAWTELLDRAFPLGRSGKEADHVHNVRTGLNALFQVARVELGIENPRALTPELLLECVHRVRAPHRLSEWRRVSALQSPSFEGAGDWADPVMHMIASTLRTLRRVSALPYLAAPAGASLTVTNFEGFCELLELHGLDERWKTFFIWYRDYSLLDFRQLRARQSEFPSRPEARHLKQSGFTRRLGAARAYLGLAKQAFAASFAALGPNDVFGTHFEMLTSMMIQEWGRSASMDGGAAHKSSAGLRDLIMTAGLTAQALLERSLHESTRTRRSTPPRDSNNVLIAAQESVADDRTVEERALNTAYIDSRRTCDSLLAECRKDAGGSGKNTVKDLRRSIAETPFENFCAAQEELLRRVQQAAESGRETSSEMRALIVATFVNGLLVSSCPRRSEIAHLREGVQTNLRAGIRSVTVRAVDRKNEIAHNYTAREKWLPDWLLVLYFGTVRPAIASSHALADGPNPFVILNPNTGRPYGCMEEHADGSGRDENALKDRLGGMAELWTRHVADAFASLKLFLPIGAQRFTMHMRNVGGHWVFQRHGLTAAANFLGDDPKSVLDTYAALDGDAVDTSS